MDFDSEKPLHFRQIDQPVGKSVPSCALPVVVQQICQFICVSLCIFTIFIFYFFDINIFKCKSNKKLKNVILI
jgi:hypothetical protein